VAFLGSDKVIPGNWLKIYLKVARGMKILFSVTKHDGQQQHIELGRSIFDMAKDNSSPKLYQINTTPISKVLLYSSTI
jgi:hypothetical protein